MLCFPAPVADVVVRGRVVGLEVERPGVAGFDLLPKDRVEELTIGRGDFQGVVGRDGGGAHTEGAVEVVRLRG